MSKVGNQLKEKRESLGLSIEDVVNQTKIQKVYIDAIEKNDLSFFQNQDFYQQVFVGRYADFLGMDKNAVLSALQDDRNDYKEEVAAKAAQKKEQAKVDAKDLLPKQPLIPKQFKRAAVVTEHVQPANEIEETKPEETTLQQDIYQEEVIEPKADLNVTTTPELQGQSSESLVDLDDNAQYFQPTDSEADREEISVQQETKHNEVDEQFNQLLEEINQNVDDENVDETQYFDNYGQGFDDVEQEETPALEQADADYNDDPFAQYDPSELDHSLIEPVQQTDYKVEAQALEQQDQDEVVVPDTLHVETQEVTPFPSYDDKYVDAQHAFEQPDVQEQVESLETDNREVNVYPDVQPQQEQVQEDQDLPYTQDELEVDRDDLYLAEEDELETDQELNTQTNEEEELNNDHVSDLLNSSIFEDIEKINQQVEATREAAAAQKEQDEYEATSYSHNEPQNFDFNKMSDSLQHTQVIDLTNGIDLEDVTTGAQPELQAQTPQVEDTVDIVAQDNEMVTEPATKVEEKVVEPTMPTQQDSDQPQDLSAFFNFGDESKETKSLNEANVEVPNMQTNLEETSKLDDIIAEKGLANQHTSELEQILSEKTKPRKQVDPNEETKQMKVAKALGDNNELEESKVKRAKIIDTVLVVLIILLLCYLLYLLFTNNIFGK